MRHITEGFGYRHQVIVTLISAHKSPTHQPNYSTVTDLAKFLGLSTSVPLAQAV